MVGMENATNQTGGIDVAVAWQSLGQRLRTYAARRVAPADADDIVQSVMVKLLERRDAIEAESVRAWLFTVTRNAVAEHYRQRKSSVDLEALENFPERDEDDPADRTIGALSDCLRPMLDALGPADAQLLQKVDLEGEAQIELAASLGIPLSTLKSRVQRARTKLRAAFDACCVIERGRGGAPISYEPRTGRTPEPCSGERGRNEN